MAYKFIPSEVELNTVAAELAALGRPGMTALMWLRANHGRLMELNKAGWTWRWIAAVMDRAKITYRTGNPWPPDCMRTETHRIRREMIRAGLAESSGSREGNPGRPETALPAKSKIITYQSASPEPGGSESAPPRFRPVRMKIHEPAVPKTAEELARIAKIRADVFGTEK